MKEVKVFTVSSFNDDIVIEKYLKTVTYHVVIGMNFFADFMQSFTDVFGGKSDSYQKRLREINSEVINGIKQEVHKIGGNCAIDLKIDNDEISAKGKSMIMVTAIATAVIIKKENVNSSINNLTIDDFTITHSKLSHTIQMLVYKQELIERKGQDIYLASFCEHDKLKANDVYKDLLIPSKDFLLNAIDSNNKLTMWKDSIELILNLNSAEIKREFIYDFMKEILNRLNDQNFKLVKHFFDESLIIFLNQRLIDNERNYEWFNMDDINFKTLGLYLMGFNKIEYNSQDLKYYKRTYEELIDEVSTKSLELDESIKSIKMFKMNDIDAYIKLFKKRIDALEYIYN